MSLVLPVFYHWSRTANRTRIQRTGLRPTTPTAGRFDDTFKAVCLGTSPSHAWSLSGAIFGERGESWDLWQVTLDDGDEVHPLPILGYRLEEVRVANRIPKSRVWYVAARVIAAGRAAK